MGAHILWAPSRGLCVTYPGSYFYCCCQDEKENPGPHRTPLRGYRLRVAGMAPPAAAPSWHTSPGDWMVFCQEGLGVQTRCFPPRGTGWGHTGGGRAVGLHLILDLGPLPSCENSCGYRSIAFDI